MDANRKLYQRSATLFTQEASMRLSEIVQQKSGICIKTDKNYLIQSRLQNRLIELQIQDLNNYVNLILDDSDEMQVCIELLTTHKTEWFREIVHFQWLKKELANYQNTSKPFSVWSGACSSGAEVYSLLFLLLKEGLNSNQIKILGTDISTPILDRAVNLPFEPEFSIQKDFLLKNSKNAAKIEKELESALVRSIKFKYFNLIKDKLDLPFKFDVIFLRNVLIYFDRPTVLMVCQNLGHYLKPNGHLVLGISESLHDELPEFKAIGNSVYQYRPRGSQ
jgi:chemotaxis protein methyltransferase CheR